MTAAFVSMPIHPERKTDFVIYTVLMAVLTGGVLVWWWRSAERRQGIALPLLLLGGAVSVVCEPVFDNLVLFWYPPHQQLEAFHAFGRSIPICVVIGYAWFCGGLPYLASRLFQRGMSTRGIWALAGVVFVIDFVAVGLTSWLKIAGFYGGQPFDVAGYPLWWGAVDTANVALGGALLYYLLPRLRGARRLYLLLIPTWVTGATAVAVAGPVEIALNSRWSMAGKTAAALATVALGLGIVDLVASRLKRESGDVRHLAPAVNGRGVTATRAVVDPVHSAGPPA
jgi:hypothetical protein